MSLRPIIISLTTGRTSLSSLRLGSLPSKTMQSRSLGSFAVTAQYRFGTLTKANITKYCQRPNLAVRSMASSSSSSGEKKASEKANVDSEEATSSEIVLTPGEKVVVGSRLFFWSGVFAFASVCAYYIGKELIPTKMSPNTVFDKATDIIRQNREVQQRFGEAFKTYGRDHGGHREGRRNFIEHTEYVNQDDGTKRTRVRFNLEGPYGQAFVFAEVSKDMPSGEYVYILVQDKRNGAVITVQDNRSSLLAKKLAGGDKDGQDVFSQLLSGGKK
ncbi:mitochondrial import inner membrane translocase subunit Tim21 [Skeletonema marinoi]|uniref:Mitochondrial import inner membrane translocase subunit Tim21 n=1 Tax=Skeletonema marinoi TaxID=267567 RepID=A0AAD8YPD8_9STRA|nr:mitochondrial import inner membrane translocase subunit Tim21 [Skeletonema marinoi]